MSQSAARRVPQSLPALRRTSAADATVPGPLCQTCGGRATDLHGRPVMLSNAGMSGGFVARHRDDDPLCAQVSRDGRVLIGGLEFRAAEARFGGTFV